MANTLAGPAAMRAGYNAYYMADSGGHFGANFKPHPRTSPYSQHPQRTQWLKGWQIAQKNHSVGGQFSYDPLLGLDLGYLGKAAVVDKQAKQREFQRKQAEFKAKQKGKASPSKEASKAVVKTPTRHTPWVKTVKPTSTVSSLTTQGVEPTINLRRLDKFNKKHRTKV